MAPFSGHENPRISVRCCLLGDPCRRVANTRSATLQKQLSATGQVAQSAQAGVDAARTDIAKLRITTAALAKESQSALDAANSENIRAKANSAEVARLNSDTQRRLSNTDRLVKRSAKIAASSQQIAERAAQDASKSREIAQRAASNALASEHAAMAAAVKAHVYRLPQTTIAAIKAALSSLPSTTSVFIACANGLEEVCGQLTSAARSVGIDPTVREGQAFLSAGFDADPLARTPNPDITIAFMARYASAAHAIDRAVAEAGLLTELVAFPPNTVKPNLEINLLYVAATP